MCGQDVGLWNHIIFSVRTSDNSCTQSANTVSARTYVIQFRRRVASEADEMS